MIKATRTNQRDMDIEQVHQAVLNRENFNYKFKDSPITGESVATATQTSITGDTLHPGWAEPTFGAFSKRMVDKPVLMGFSEFIKMTSVQHDLDMLDTEVELHAQRGRYDNTTNEITAYDRLGESLHLVDEEVPMNPTRKQLFAVPFQAKSIVYDNYLDENVEKESFFSDWCGYLAEKCGPAYQRQALFSVHGRTVPRNQGTGLTMNDGILQQLKDIHKAHNGEWGFADIIPKKSIVFGLQAAVQQFIDNNANYAGAKIILPPHIYSRMTTEVANWRKTGLGDVILQNGQMYTLQGLEIVQDPVLRDTRNGWNRGYYDHEGKLYHGTVKEELIGSPVDSQDADPYSRIVYGFITAPKNIIFGVMHDITMKTQWDIDILGYKIAMLLKGDYIIHWDQDTMAIPFTLDDKVRNSIIFDEEVSLDGISYENLGDLSPQSLYDKFMPLYYLQVKADLGIDYDSLNQRQKFRIDNAKFTEKEWATITDKHNKKYSFIEAQDAMVGSYGPNWGDANPKELAGEFASGKLKGLLDKLKNKHDIDMDKKTVTPYSGGTAQTPVPALTYWTKD